MVVIVAFLAMRFNERQGRWPFVKAKPISSDKAGDDSSDEEAKVGFENTDKKSGGEAGGIMTKVRSVGSGSPTPPP